MNPSVLNLSYVHEWRDMNPSVINLSWQEVENGCLEISHKLNKSKFVPDLILPVLWGGVIPARLLMDIMNLDRLYCTPITARSYENCEAKKYIEVDIPAPLIFKKPEALMNILIVEEIVDSGRTVETIIKELMRKFPSIPLNQIRVATLFSRVVFRPGSVVIYDNFFCYREIYEEWVIFPWDKQEYMRSNFT